MTAQDFFEKYWDAMVTTNIRLGGFDESVVRTILHLAIGDAVAVGQALAGQEAATLRQRLERSHERALALQAELDSALADVAALGAEVRQAEAERDDLRQQLATANRESATRGDQLAIERREVRTLIEEIESLREQLSEASTEIGRLSRENQIAVDTLNSTLEQHRNGAGVDPTTAAQSETMDWGRNHQAWQGLPAADLAVIDQLASGQAIFRQFGKTLRRDLVHRTIRHLAKDGKLSGGTYDRLRPEWMPTQGAAIVLSSEKRWPSLLAEALIQPTTE